MSVYKVKRRIDTVIIEMDIAVAEQLTEILMLVQDNTRMGRYYGSDIDDLRDRLDEDAEVRFPSPLYKADAHRGYIELRDITPSEREAMR